MNDSPKVEEPIIHLALPKGHMQEGVFSLLEEAGMKVRNNFKFREGSESQRRYVSSAV